MQDINRREVLGSSKFSKIQLSIKLKSHSSDPFGHENNVLFLNL